MDALVPQAISGGVSRLMAATALLELTVRMFGSLRIKQARVTIAIGLLTLLPSPSLARDIPT